MDILSTERLHLREVTAADAEFILELLNTPKFKAFIGDRGVRTIADAAKYIEGRFTKSYIENGFGLWLMERAADGGPVGICGFVSRNELPDPDIGFALLPQFERQGYAFEAADAVMRYGRETLKISRVLAITTLDNESSARLLGKIGFEFEREIDMGGETLKLFAADI
ncbi:MAG: GNAT family N-acetyltransferase [Acidobacteria bacterium]|nr:GNAT family N-acetyltransferase [Acidobacteriota bacterium]